MKIGIINYQIGNLTSVQNAFASLGLNVDIIDNPAKAHEFDKLILPGVGAFGKAMQNLEKSGWVDVLNELVMTSQKPIIGLCLGMQLMFESSEENGPANGLGWIKGSVKSIASNTSGLPRTHMGWNSLKLHQTVPLTANLPVEENDVYFVHSYYCLATNREDVVATTSYGIEMDVIIQRNNIMGCQFHPEKSHTNGLIILQNFAQL